MKTIKKSTEAKKIGRPSLYSELLADTICHRLANKESLRGICLDEKMPNRSTVHRWMDEMPDFATKCARAREEQADFIVEDMESIENNTLSGALDAAPARVVLSSMQWRASKLAPKKYGDKLELSGDPKSPLVVIKDFSGK